MGGGTTAFPERAVSSQTHIILNVSLALRLPRPQYHRQLSHPLRRLPLLWLPLRLLERLRPHLHLAQECAPPFRPTLALCRTPSCPTHSNLQPMGLLLLPKISGPVVRQR